VGLYTTRAILSIKSLASWVRHFHSSLTFTLSKLVTSASLGSVIRPRLTSCPLTKLLISSPPMGLV